MYGEPFNHTRLNIFIMDQGLLNQAPNGFCLLEMPQFDLFDPLYRPNIPSITDYNKRDIATGSRNQDRRWSFHCRVYCLSDPSKCIQRLFSMVNSYLLSSVLCIGAHLGFSLVCTSCPLLSTARHLQIGGDKAHRQSEPC